MDRLTHREFLTWGEWFKQQWNEPNRSDHYLMQIACEIVRVNLKKGAAQKLKLSQFLLPFKWIMGGQAVSPEEAARQAKRTWIARLGGKVKIVKKPKESDG